MSEVHKIQFLKPFYWSDLDMLGKNNTEVKFRISWMRILIHSLSKCRDSFYQFIWNELLNSAKNYLNEAVKWIKEAKN